jgi:Carboxypeptidase regulatory-like domain
MRILMKHASLLGLLITLLLPFSNYANAQSNQGAISGLVTDASGATVAGATVVALNVATGQTQTTVSSSAGDYHFPSLQIGSYTVSVAARSFRKVDRTNVIVQIQSVTTLDVTLSIGSETETVTVNVDAPQVQTESADVGTVVSPKQVLDLPLSTNGSAIRNSQDFVFLTPATYGTGTSGGTFEGGVSGGQAFGSEILFDGASLQVESFGDGFANEILPSVEATGEFKVLIGGIPAQYGRTTGGIQSYASKSGTNDYHGTAFEIYRNTDLDANTWFNNLDRGINGPTSSNGTPPDNKNDYGVALGGPVRIPHLYNGKDKTFFFFAWEQFRQTQGYSNLITLPTPANLKGDFSANIGAPILDSNNNQIINPCDGTAIRAGQVFNPATTQTVNGQQCRTAYPNNIINSPISPVAQAIVGYIPQASNALTNNFTFAGTYPIVSTVESIRIDQAFGQNNRVFVSYNVRDNVRNNNNLPQFQLPVTSFLTSQDLPTHLVRVGYDHIFSPTLLNHALIAFTRVLNKEGFITPSQGKDYSQLVGLPGGSGFYFPGILINGPNNNESSRVNFGDYVDPNNNGFNSKISDNSYYISDAISLTKGRHNLTVGGEYRYAVSISSFVSVDSGSTVFGRAQTAGTATTTANSGDGFASFLLGQVAQATVKQNFVTIRNVGQYSALYVQDEFKLNKDLNLSLGLRYDVDLPFKELHNFGSQFNPNIINTGAQGTNTPGALEFAGDGAGKDGFSSRYSNVYYKNIEPRVGVTWAPSSLNHQTVFSAAYSGLNAPILQWQQIYGGVPAGYSSISQINNNANPFTAGELLDPGSLVTPGIANPGAYGVPNIPTNPSFDRSQLNGQNVNYTQRDFGKPGYDQTWTATVQQQFATDLILTLGYLGERGVHLGSNLLYLNNLPQQNFTLGSQLSDPFTGSGAPVDGVTAPYDGFQGTVAQALRPFPQYHTVNTGAYGENHGQLSYNALTAKLERRYHSGLNLLASYTWSKILTDTGNIIGGSLGGAYTASIQNPLNLKAEKAVSPQDTPQIFVVSYIYDLPFGKNKAFLSQGRALNYLVGGWSVSGIQRYQSGQPLSFGCATAIPGYDNCIRYNFVPGQSLRSTARRNGSFNPAVAGSNLWYNPAGVSDPNANITRTTSYAFGDKPAYEADDRAFGYLEEDFGLIKRTFITERVAFQFRAEAFNAFNRHVFNTPDNNPHDAGFGTVGSTANSPRALQLTFRVEF